MASAVGPSTPTSSGPRVTPAPASSTGYWRHPRFNDIVRRQYASTFTGDHVNTILWNAGTLIGSFVIGHIPVIHPLLAKLTIYFYPYSSYALSLFRVIWFINIIIALSPLVRPKDDLSDIPLTPSQRALFGLDPITTSSQKPGSQYITPPRYPRSSTPRGGTPGSRNSSYSGSPLSGKGSPANRPMGGSPFSPSASPLLQKVVAGGGRDLNRRQSYGSPSSLGAGVGGAGSSLLSSVATPSTPSPTGGKGTSVSLNSRWLYERNRGSPGGGKFFS
ncbi:hypothetical protein FGG08_000592 [Glutinoglossum americanum]|uniref:Nuclear pore complex component n=1 Tax=Glutinoglossum americanum TaxID=1670608 RepID=A0A9P8L127_9PEZI|nr:hypothetical protein FGG08_000592 [Glutinoglossum americanum]